MRQECNESAQEQTIVLYKSKGTTVIILVKLMGIFVSSLHLSVWVLSVQYFRNRFQANLVKGMVVSNDYHRLCYHAKRLVCYVYIFDTIKQDEDGSTGSSLTLLKTTVWQSTNHGLLKSLVSDSHFRKFKRIKGK